MSNGNDDLPAATLDDPHAAIEVEAIHPGWLTIHGDPEAKPDPNAPIWLTMHRDPQAKPDPDAAIGRRRPCSPGLGFCPSVNAIRSAWIEFEHEDRSYRINVGSGHLIWWDEATDWSWIVNVRSLDGGRTFAWEMPEASGLSVAPDVSELVVVDFDQVVGWLVPDKVAETSPPTRSFTGRKVGGKLK